MDGSKAHEWLDAYSERVGDIPGLQPDDFGVRLLQSRSGSESALREIFSVSLKVVLDVARDVWQSNPRRAVWEVVQDANSVIQSAVSSFFGCDWQEYQTHLRTAVLMRVPEVSPA